MFADNAFGGVVQCW